MYAVFFLLHTQLAVHFLVLAPKKSCHHVWDCLSSFVAQNRDLENLEDSYYVGAYFGIVYICTLLKQSLLAAQSLHFTEVKVKIRYRLSGSLFLCDYHC